MKSVAQCAAERTFDVVGDGPSCEALQISPFCAVEGGGLRKVFPVHPIEVIFSSIERNVGKPSTTLHPPPGRFQGSARAGMAEPDLVCASPMRGAICSL